MDIIDFGNNEFLVYGVFLNQDGMFIVMMYIKSKMFKIENGVCCWLERNLGE